MLTKELEFTLNQAFKEAREQHHEFMTVEHLLLALLDDPSAAARRFAERAKATWWLGELGAAQAR